MHKLWDAGVFPRPAEFSDLSTLWSSSHAECTDRWLRMLRLQLQQGEEELHALRWAERSQASEQSRQAAIARFYDGGELRRLPHPQPHFIHTPMLRSSVPTSIAVAGDRPSLLALRTAHAHIPGLEFLHGLGSVVVSEGGGEPPLWVRLLPTQTKLAHTATDRLSAWEHFLALEATARRGVCSCCLRLGRQLTPVTAIGGGSR
jgi:hypothetical protein